MKAPVVFLTVAGLVAALSGNAAAAVANDYCSLPPFISQSVPPLVMFEVGRDHKLYYAAYNDAVDLDDDGRIESEYTHSIDYYGYFDPYKCYTHSGGSGSSDQFTPVTTTADKFCSAGQWSGNVLNWLTMSRLDVLKKVLYGGQRSADSNTSTVLQRVLVPQDAHSWGKELTGRLCRSGTTFTNSCVTSLDCDSGYTCTDKSTELVGIAAADAPSTCASAVSIGAWGGDNMLVVRYSHAATQADANACGATSLDLLGSYEPANYLSHFYVNDFNDASLSVAADHGDNTNLFVVTEFQALSTDKVGNNRDWQFIIDGDDGVELEIDGNVVASYYGCHPACATAPGTLCSPTQASGAVTLIAGWHRLIVRQTEKNGQDGVRVWYKKPGAAAWTLFGTTNLNLRAPSIAADKACTMKSLPFIETGTPTTGVARRHLFCNTTLADNGQPLLRRLTNMTNRVWEWSAKERPVCDTSLGTPTDFTVKVEVCKDGLREENCKDYSGTGKPTGLLQKYGEGKAGDKVCSKTMSKACSADSGCAAGEGLCIDRSPMYFGLLTDSYTKNLSGGVLRKNIGSISDESNINNGIFQTSENTQGNIIITLDRLKTVGFDYGTHQYDCGWITTGPLTEGNCKMWGNPIAEMLYESMRYFAGKNTPTAEFTYSGSQDAGLSLSKPAWGYPKGSDQLKPYDVYPACAKPFVLLISDVNPSYDSDQLPGSSFRKPDGTSFTEDATAPQLKLGTTSGGVSLLNQLVDTIGTDEGIAGNTWFVGDNGTLNDFICSSKTVTKLSLLRGMCPEEPTKLGSYYTAAVAYYGKTKMKEITGINDVNTYAVALSSPVADLKIKAGSGYITILPIGKSVSGGSNVYQSCFQKCTGTYADEDGLHIAGCSASAFCPSNQIVNFFVEDIRYNAARDVIYAKFRINFEDVEQGADHDMDAIATYEVCTQSAIDASYGSCSGSLGSDIEIKLSSDYAAGSIDQVMGFVISGTTSDGVYLPVKDRDVGNSSTDADSPAMVRNLPVTWSRTFSPRGTTAGILKNPLWYAAKWGGFLDRNGNGKPDLQSEWDKDGDGTPDNYFLVVNPLKLERQIDRALSDILARVSSGTAASILSNSEGSGANILQALFFPKKIFDAQSEVNWIGEVHNLWYYIDPFINNSTIREDTDYVPSGSNPDPDHVLNLKTDYVANFFFDSATNQTLVKRLKDNDGNGTGDTTIDTVAQDDVRSIWKAGKLLWQRNVATSPRTLYTVTETSSGSPLRLFSSKPEDGYFNTWPTVISALQAADENEAKKIIDYVGGTEVGGYRSRLATIGAATHAWKLGDVVSSTPRLQSGIKLNAYDLDPPGGYADGTYGEFVATTAYKNRGMVYVGANDGMLHAFKLGKLDVAASGSVKARLIGDDLGEERWTFIPKNALPYLKYLANEDYNHIYYVDGPTTLFDASIAFPSGCASANYADCSKTSGSWRTILIGSMGFGGASKNSDSTCTDKVTTGTCVKTPVNGLGYSSYFALDITDPENPQFLWEFSNAALGYSTTGPAIVRISAQTDGKPDPTKNGKWFAVFASGPTGPINTATHQFLGKSDQNLKFFVLDLKTGTLVRTIDTGIAEAFGGSLAHAVFDAERADTAKPGGSYQDDAVYLGYTKKAADGTWTDGGIVRLVTKENLDPTTWVTSKVVDGTGPVTTGIAKLANRITKELWLYFGTGRYYYSTDDPDTARRLYGVKDPCYTAGNDIDNSCTTTVAMSELTDQTTDVLDGLDTGKKKGWFIGLSGPTGGYGAERCITDPVALLNGAIYFTTFMPTADICGFGGSSFLWTVKYDTGAKAPAGALEGKAVIQLSTGAFEQVNLKTAFPGNEGRSTHGSSVTLTGKPPGDPPTFITKSNNPPVKKILHIRER